MVPKTDFFIGGLVGFFAGMFAIPTLMNLGFRNPAILLTLPWVLAIVFVIGILVSGALAKFLPIFSQFGRFVAVGVLNTTIDFGVLNLISAAAGVTAGVVIGGVNVPGFVVAVTNSYFWNKLWVFKQQDTKLFHDLPQFFAVTAGGVILNSLIVVMLTSFLHPVFGFTPARWLTIAKLCATAFTLVWNFLGYKFIVFRQRRPV